MKNLNKPNKQVLVLVDSCFQQDKTFQIAARYSSYRSGTLPMRYAKGIPYLEISDRATLDKAIAYPMEWFFVTEHSQIRDLDNTSYNYAQVHLTPLGFRELRQKYISLYPHWVNTIDQEYANFLKSIMDGAAQKMRSLQENIDHHKKILDQLNEL